MGRSRDGQGRSSKKIRVEMPLGTDMITRIRVKCHGWEIWEDEITPLYDRAAQME